MSNKEVAGPVAVLMAAAALVVAVAAGWFLINREPTRVRSTPPSPSAVSRRIPGQPNQTMPAERRSLNKTR